jgi:hypothetical protein
MLMHQLVVPMCACNVELMTFLRQLAVAGVAATAGAALLPEATVIAGVSVCSLSIHAIVATLMHHARGGLQGATAAVIAKGLTTTKTALLAHSGTITKICERFSWRQEAKYMATEAMVLAVTAGMVLPKAIDRVASEVGGLSALQREGEWGGESLRMRWSALTCRRPWRLTIKYYR